MPSVMAIVNKTVFDTCGPWRRAPRLGHVWDTARYASKHAQLAKLKGGGDLYLVTVRPGGRLWLVAILRAPKRDAHGYRAQPNTVPIDDVSLVRARLRFVDGAPLPADGSKLAMSLQTPRVLAPEDVELLEGAPPMRRPSAAEAARADELLAAVFADPTNRDVRLVCADGLLELGDPRGELITVQDKLAETPGDELLRIREHQLLKTHRKAWLGPIAKFADRCHRTDFARGFLDECLVNKAHITIWKDVLATKDDPIWSTVRSHNGPLELVFAPTMRALREIEYDGPFEEAQHAPRPWRQLLEGAPLPFEMLDHVVGVADPRREVQALATCRTLPALTHLKVHNDKHTTVDHLTPLYTSEVLDRLAHLELVFNLPSWERAGEWADTLRPLFERARPPLLIVRMCGDGPEITFRTTVGAYRDAEVELGEPLSSSFANQRGPVTGLIAILRAARGLRRITVRPRPAEEGRRVPSFKRQLKAVGGAGWTIA